MFVLRIGLLVSESTRIINVFRELSIGDGSRDKHFGGHGKG